MSGEEALVAAPPGLFRGEMLAAAQAAGPAADDDGGLGARLRLPAWPIAATPAALAVLAFLLFAVPTEVRTGLPTLATTADTVTVVVPPGMPPDRLRSGRIVVTADGVEYGGRLGAIRTAQAAGASAVTVAEIHVAGAGPFAAADGVRVRVVTGSRPLIGDVLATEEVAGR